VQIATRAHHLFSGCEFYFDAAGNVVHWNLMPTDYKAKVDFMRLLISEYQVTSDECVFVGDGKNDVHLARQVGLSIAFNGHPLLRSASSVQVDGDDFSVIARVVAEHPGRSGRTKDA
jgi:phosphoserine phosphatase